ncbi:MAG: NUDIX hydrolase [Longimicrobiales bacterium]
MNEKLEPGWIESRLIHHGRVIHLSLDKVRFPDGSTGELEMIRHSGASAVLPVLDDPASSNPRLLLIRQYRYASGGYLLEVPAGRPDQPGEDWQTCARRELEEETGLVAGKLAYLTAIYTAPGFTDEYIRLYLATELTPGRSKLDDDEFVERVEITLSDALELLRDGKIEDAKTICTLLYAATFVLGKQPDQVSRR